MMRAWMATVAWVALTGCDGKTNDTDTDTDTVDDTGSDTGDVETTACTTDGDGDGYGDDGAPIGCDAPEAAAVGGDCDDTDAAIHPDVAEVCDEVDNDCDGLIDDDDDGLDTSTAIVHYPDADGDGFGDTGAEATSCALPDGHTVDSGDCDDDSAEVHPDMDERCSGVDDDCDSTTVEEGLAWFTDADGNGSDYTDRIGGGTSGSPVHSTLIFDGTLRICGGDWYTTFDILADVTITGAGQSDTFINASGVRSVVSVAVEGAEVVLSDLTLLGGQGSGYVSTTNSSDGGGGLYCAGAGTTVTLQRVALRNNEAYIGGGIFGEQCTFDADDTSVTQNSADYGGGLAMLSGTATLSASRIEDNVAEKDGGGMFIASETGSASVSLYSTRVLENIAKDGAGAALTDAALTCAKDSAIIANQALTSSSAAVLLDDNNRSASFIARGCDLGTDSGGDNNTPYDISSSTTDYGASTTVTCSTSGC